MKCPNCGVENAEEARSCAICGAPLSAASKQKPAPEPVVEAPAEPVADQAPMMEPMDEPQDEQSNEPAVYVPEPTPEKEKNNKAGLLAVGLLLLAMLAVAAVILVRRAVPGVDAPPQAQPDVQDPTVQAPVTSEPLTPVYPVTSNRSPALLPEGAMDTVVGEYGDRQIDNRFVNYFYWSEYRYLLNIYGSYLSTMMDPYAPLDQQSMGEDDPNFTWQDYLLESAEATLQETLALMSLANAAGYTLSAEDEAYLADVEQQLRTYAAENGYRDLSAYLCTAYGSDATEETFLAFLRESVLSSSYAQMMYDSVNFTEDEIAEYYTLHGYAESGLAQDDVRNIDVRHILIMPETDEAGNKDWAAALAEAERILALWQTTPDEDSFAALAEEYSTDPGSNTNGGLYTGVQVGQMVQPFNDWCFDTEREVGDTGIVETSYGYHIMYFSGREERPAWMETVLADMRLEAYRSTIEEQLNANNYTLNYDAVVLAAPNGLYE